jgi:membrane protein implicated in regulation of membrane protease activity
MGWVDSELALTALGAMLSPTTLFLSVLALVVGERPMRTGLWFYLGALGATLLVGVVAAFVLGNAAASLQPNSPKTWVAVVDVVASLVVLWFVVRFLRRPRDPRRAAAMIDQMSKVASSPVVAIIAAGATLANPGAFIPLALKDISETNPSAAQYVAEWVAFALVSLLPLSVALVALAIAREATTRVLTRAREWLEQNARTIGAVILLLLAAVLMRNGIAGLTS